VFGDPDQLAQRLMGWSNSSMTTRYQHLTPELRRDVAEQVGGLLWVPDETTDETTGEATL